MANWKAVTRYAFMPQVAPRLRNLFFSGFAYIAYFMAQIFRAVQLLPADHPYLNNENMGRYGVRHVTLEAARSLKFRYDHIDQLLIFGLMMLGMIIFVAQIFLLFGATLIQGAQAAGLPTNFFEYITTPNAQDDIAFVLLDRVFGLPDFFLDGAGAGTCVAQGIPCFDPNLTADGTSFGDYDRTVVVSDAFPWPIHDALRGMLQLYSIGLLVVAVMIFLYFIIAIVAETAQTGTPFGRRFNHVWAPIRMVVALGLLVPLSSGLNSAQYVLMYAAKWGSSFATNGWIIFHDTALTSGGTVAGDIDSLIATPNSPPVNSFLQFMTVVATCKNAYETIYHRSTEYGRDPVFIDAYLVNASSGEALPRLLLDEVLIDDVLPYFSNNDIIFVFGQYKAQDHQAFEQNVAPLCGSVRINVTYVDEDLYPGAYSALQSYYTLVGQLWAFIDSAMPHTGDAMPASGVPDAAATLPRPDCSYDASASAGTGQNVPCVAVNLVKKMLPVYNDPTAPDVLVEHLVHDRNGWQEYIDISIENAVLDQAASVGWAEDFRRYGWAGAAMWYNKIAQMNGSVTGSAYSLPFGENFPMIMEDVLSQRAASDGTVTGENRYSLYRGPDQPIALEDPAEAHIARAMFQAYNVWGDSTSEQASSTGIFIGAINMIFGTHGLFNIHENADRGVHPLAQLVSIGKGIMDTSIRNFGIAAGAGLAGGMLNLFDKTAGMAGIGQAASGFFLQVATIGLSIGFVLYYIVPFLPFIYFFFAVGGWIKGIFEAMVGVPLWALAHIRIDGNGLPGDAAMGGYYLILEIFLRPILIIFGFLASITIFAAQVQVLHEIWGLVVTNASGFDADAAASGAGFMTGSLNYARSAIDELFFTVIYAIIVYMIGMASFKMIDLIPNHILRWMGANVSTFGDQNGDPAENLVRNSYMGANMLGGSAQGAMQQGISGMNSTAGAIRGRNNAANVGGE